MSNEAYGFVSFIKYCGFTTVFRVSPIKYCGFTTVFRVSSIKYCGFTTVFGWIRSREYHKGATSLIYFPDIQSAGIMMPGLKSDLPVTIDLITSRKRSTLYDHVYNICPDIHHR